MDFHLGRHFSPVYRLAPLRVRQQWVLGWIFALFVVACLSLCLIDPSWADERVYPPLFGTAEKMFPDSSVFPKWTEMLQHLAVHEALEAKPPVPCKREQGLNFCEIKKWKAFTESLRGEDKMSMLNDVDRFMNAYPYVEDIVNYGVDDYWATPHEHISNGGDCEDYAIAKYITLKRLGVPVMDMRIVVLNDLNLRVQHAVLAVYIGNRAFILDNQTQRVLPSDLIYHYQPVYSLTEGAWWMHILTAARR